MCKAQEQQMVAEWWTVLIAQHCTSGTFAEKSTNFLAERAVALSVSMCVCVCMRDLLAIALTQAAFLAQT